MLEIGCGGGANAARLLARCPDGQVTGIDYSEASVEKSRDFNAEAITAGRCRIELANVQALPFADSSFDLATAFETIYFWPDLAEAFLQVFRVLKKGGQFFICNEVDGGNPADYEMEKKVSGLRIYKEQEIRELLEGAGFSRITVYRDGKKRWICFLAVR
ncbi:MAG: class I SAM-dependent methyltransferase [Lachnospiraceae bacterium]|nr:class I SAM-dependent methyltransferase [Lachnospiraceae bacterium]